MTAGPELTAALKKVVLDLEDDLRARVQSQPDVRVAWESEHRAAVERERHRADLAAVARRPGHPGRGRLGPGHGVPPVLRGQPAARAGLDRRTARTPPGGPRRRAGLLPPQPRAHRPRVAAPGHRPPGDGQGHPRPGRVALAAVDRLALRPGRETARRVLARQDRRRRPGPRLHRPGPVHPLPRRPLPGPVRVREEDLRPAADPGVRRGVHPRPDPGTGPRRAPAGRVPAHRPGLRVGPLPARRVRPARRALGQGGARAGRAGPGAEGARRDPRRRPQPVRRRDRPVPARRRRPQGLRADLARTGAGVHPAPGRRRLPAARRAPAAADVRGLDPDSQISGFAYATEDLAALKQILAPGRYDVVVGNPPYITVKDKTLNAAYRRLLPRPATARTR